MIDTNPAVTKLHAHLEGEQYVLFPSNATQAQHLEITNRTTSLTTHGIFFPAYWRLQHEIGDVACGFRAIARHFLGDPELHYQIRQQLVQYMSENRHNNDLRIYGHQRRTPLWFRPVTLYFCLLYTSPSPRD